MESRDALLGVTAFDHLAADTFALMALRTWPLKLAPDNAAQVGLVKARIQVAYAALDSDDRETFANLSMVAMQRELLVAMGYASLNAGRTDRPWNCSGCTCGGGPGTCRDTRAPPRQRSDEGSLPPLEICGSRRADSPRTTFASRNGKSAWPGQTTLRCRVTEQRSFAVFSQCAEVGCCSRSPFRFDAGDSGRLPRTDRRLDRKKTTNNV